MPCRTRPVTGTANAGIAIAYIANNRDLARSTGRVARRRADEPADSDDDGLIEGDVHDGARLQSESAIVVAATDGGCHRATGTVVSGHGGVIVAAAEADNGNAFARRAIGEPQVRADVDRRTDPAVVGAVGGGA